MAEVVTKGTGKVERTADRAEVQVGFETTGSTRNEAVEALTRRVATVEELVGRVEVRARTLSVHDNWNGEQRAGSRATQQYTLRVDDLTALDDLLSVLVQAEPSWLNGPSWLLKDDVDAVREAQRDAVADARRRAEGYAEALGARLGPLHRITDGDAEVWAQERAMVGYGASAGGGPQIDQLNLEAQQIVVTVRCTATWTLLD